MQMFFNHVKAESRVEKNVGYQPIIDQEITTVYRNLKMKNLTTQNFERFKRKENQPVFGKQPESSFFFPNCKQKNTW